MPFNNQKLIKAAEATFGERWRRPLAKAMGRHKTQIIRWASGRGAVSEADLARAMEVCREHIEKARRALG